MNAEMVTQIIQLILAPVVMVTACALTQGGLLAHYAAINDRLRAIARERLDLLQSEGETRTTDATSLSVERLMEIDYQIPDLLQRHKLAHDAVLVIYCAILLFVMDMFTIAVAVATDLNGVATAALVIFLVGISTLLAGVFLVALEIRNSHQAVSYEVQRVANLKSSREPLLQPAEALSPRTPI